MKYFEFIDEMAKRVKMCFDKEVSVEVHKVVKNNSMEYDSLIINEPGRNVTPNFYLQGMYSRYVDGIGLDSLVSEIVQKYESAYDSEKYENLSLGLYRLKRIKRCLRRRRISLFLIWQ